MIIIDWFLRLLFWMSCACITPMQSHQRSLNLLPNGPNLKLPGCGSLTVLDLNIVRTKSVLVCYVSLKYTAKTRWHRGWYCCCDVAENLLKPSFIQQRRADGGNATLSMSVMDDVFFIGAGGSFKYLYPITYGTSYVLMLNFLKPKCPSLFPV